jgi:hypothetical protein
MPDSKSRDPHNLLIFFQIPVVPPYLKTTKSPETPVNELGLPVKEYYTTQDLCKVLNIKPDTFRHRLRTGKYPEAPKVGGKHRFSENQVSGILKIEKLINRLS